MTEELQRKVKVLNELVWDRRLPWTDVANWLAQFAPDAADAPSERLHALYLLSRFTYFNASLMRALLRSLQRDLIQYPLVSRVRKELRDTLDRDLIQTQYDHELQKVRFVGIGNPSESGTHLLYYFRQENHLPTSLFVHPHELFIYEEGRASRLLDGVELLVFLDDFCGSGTQATRYSRQLLSRILAVQPATQLAYYPLFATASGLAAVRQQTQFSDVRAVAELDDSFRAFDASSRYFRNVDPRLDRDFAKRMCQERGAELERSAPLGFGNCQLLLGFAHNIPNNTLPIFWSSGHEGQWRAVFPRHTKGVGW